MTTWERYSATKAKANEITGPSTSVLEYLTIRLVENGLLVTIVSLLILFTGIGLALQLCQKDGASWFFDMAKLAFGVILGMLVDKTKKK